ncbi:MAG: hypothetical protein QW685_04405 [Saccharolobus sp.]
MKCNENFSILPIIAYTIPTFVLVYPSFFVNWLAVSNEFKLLANICDNFYTVFG